MKKVLLILVIMTLAVTTIGRAGLADNCNTGSEPGPAYQTLKGELYDIGTGEVPFLVFNTSAGDYLVANASYGRLKNLKGLPLLLTGRVSKVYGGSFMGQIEVKNYNTYYESSSDCSWENSSNSSSNTACEDTRDKPCQSFWEEVSVLGRLVDGGDNLVLLSKDQVVIELDPDTYHSLGDHLGEEIVITGSLEKSNKYSGQMEVKSYRVLTGD